MTELQIRIKCVELANGSVSLAKAIYAFITEKKEEAEKALSKKK